MKDICSQCNFPFDESPLFYTIRMRRDDPNKICKECNRINHAEESASKRQRLLEETPYETIVKKAKLFKKEYGAVSAPMLMRKFKIDFDQANQIAEKVNGMEEDED